VSAESAPFEILDHTADVGIVARGRTLAEAFAHAAEGMFSVMADLAGVRELEQRTISVTGHDWPGLLVAWLSELLYHLDVDGLLFKRFEVEELRPYALRAVAHGERIDRERHELGAGVKGISRHMLEVVEEPAGWRVQVLLDI
jgi:SHS2 domain-containing protein